MTPWPGPLHWAEQDPDRPAWIFDGRTFSYGQLAELAIRGARLLRRLGLRTGDGIAVLSPNHPFSPAVHWAAQLAGLYYTPLSVQFQRAEVQHILGDCDAKLAVREPVTGIDGLPTHNPTDADRVRPLRPSRSPGQHPSR